MVKCEFCGEKAVLKETNSINYHLKIKLYVCPICGFDTVKRVYV